MDTFYRNNLFGDHNTTSRGIKSKQYLTHQTTMPMNTRPQFCAPGMPQRSQQILPEYSEPFDLNSDYIQSAVPTPFRASVNRNDRRQHPYFRKNESVIPKQSPEQRPLQKQTMSQANLPVFEAKHSYDMSTSFYSNDVAKDYFTDRISTELNSSCFANGRNSNKRAENTFVATNKNDDIRKAVVSNSKQARPTNLNVLKKRSYFIGSIDQVIRWFRIAKQANIYALYEISAILESIKKGKSTNNYVLFLRNENGYNSSVLQAVFYSIDREIPTLQIGQRVTCVGRMIGSNKLHILDIWPNTMEEQVGIKRISFLCQRTLQESCLSSSE